MSGIALEISRGWNGSRSPDDWATHSPRETRLLRFSGEFTLGAGVFLAALAIRLPHLMEVPGFTDETMEVQVGLDALQGQWPLVDVEPYLGSLFNYLLAGAFLLFGQQAHVPRLTVTIFGAATVLLTYLLAKRLSGRVVGLLAAALMATSAVHIVNGHIAWTNCTTPFFVTAVLLSLAVSRPRIGGVPMLFAGFLYGMALQTHPSVLFLAPALVLYLLFNPSRTRRHPYLTLWPYLAAVAAVVAYGNVVAYNWLHPTAWGDAVRRTDYAFVYVPTGDSYLANLLNLLTALLRSASSSLDGGGSLADQLALPQNIPYLALFLTGVGCALRRRLWLPLLAFTIPVLSMPYFNKDYSFPIAVRYLGYLQPLLYLFMSLPLALVAVWCWRRVRLVAPLPVATALLLIALPVSSLYGYYDRYLRENSTGPTVMALGTEIRARYQAGLITEALLDPQLDWVFTAPGGRVLMALDSAFKVERIPHRTVWMAPEQLRDETHEADKAVVLVLSTASRQRLGEVFRLLPMEVPTQPYLSKDGFWAYVMPPAQRNMP